MKTNYFSKFFLAVAVISTLLLTACGGGGSSGSHSPATSNVDVLIDGNDLQINGTFRAQLNESDSIKLVTKAYQKGEEKKDIKVSPIMATKSGSNFICHVQGLISGPDYRFTAYLVKNNKEIKLMENQLAASELQNGDEIPVNINTSIKTLAYDSWKDKATNASVENFKQNCEGIGLFEDKTFQDFATDLYNNYKQCLENIMVKGDEKASVPSKKDIDSTPIGTTDLENASKPVSGSEQALIGKWYLNYIDCIHNDSDRYVYSIEFKKDHTFTDNTNYYYEDTSAPSESRRASISSRASMRYSENQQNQEPIATGTWSLDNDKIVISYTTGNKQNDHKEVYRNIVITKDFLSWTYNWNDGNETHLVNEIYKKTKWSAENKVPEPASATQALIGDWTMSTRNGEKVNPNSQGTLPSYYLFSDHTYAANLIDINNGILSDYSTDEIGKWYYEFGAIYFKPDSDNSFERGFKVDIDNNTLTITDGEYVESEQSYQEVIYGYTRNQPKPGDQIPADLVGTWYLNYEDGKPVPANNNVKVPTLILNSDGKCIYIDYDLTEYDDYMYPTGEAIEYTGSWSYSNGNLTTVIEGETMSSTATITNGELTLTSIDEETQETLTSVYRKIKYPK